MKSILFIPFTAFTICLAAQNPCTDINLNLGPDALVCVGASFTLNEHPIPGNYTWSGSPGLDCSNCPSPTFSATNAGIYILVCILETPTCNDTDLIRINVLNGQWPQVNIAADTAVCTNAVISLGGPSFPNQIYSWMSNPAGFTSPIAAPLPVPQTVNTTYYLTTTHPSCPVPRRDSVVVGVYPKPIVSLIGGATFCLGESVVLGNTIPEPQVTYLWSPDNGSLSDISAANPSATPLTAGSHTYTLKASNPGCSVMGNVSVLAIDLNLSLNQADTVTICKGTSLDIQALVTPPNAAMVNWVLMPNMVVSIDGLNATVTPTQATLYTATVQVSNCKKTANVYVKVDSLPDLLGIIPTLSDICSGQSILLQAPPNEPPIDPTHFPNLMFSWVPGTETQPFLNVSPLDSTTYKRYVKNGICIDSAEATVNVIPAPTVNVVQEMLVLCPDSSFQLQAMATVYDSIRWSPGAGLSCLDCPNPVCAPDQTNTYTLTAFYQGCTASDSVKVTLRTLPQYQFPSDLEWCAGESVPLNSIADPSGTTVYQWSSVPARPLDQIGQPVDLLDVIGIQTITYYLTADNGCPVSDFFTITATGADLMVSPSETICPETPKTLTATASLGGGQFEWSNMETTQVISVAPTATTTYTVSYTINGCTFEESVTLTVDGELPLVDFPTDLELCAGDTLVLNSLFSQDAQYSWTSNDGTFSSMEGIPPTQTLYQSIIYELNATSADGCPITKFLEVTVHNGTVNIPEDSITLCGGTPFTVSATTTGTGMLNWSPVNSPLSTLTDTLFTEQNVNYFANFSQGSPGNECVFSDSVNITVLQGFEVKIVADPDSTFNAGESVMLDAVIVPSQSINGFTFDWTEILNIPVGNTQQVTTTSMSTDTSVTYKVVVLAPNGCSQTEMITFRVYQPNVMIPNAFTPNGDGANDVFRLAILEGIARVETFEVYDRWGTKVFESADPAASWDGTIKGEAAASDVYVYKIRWRRGDGSLVPASGEVTLIR